MVCMGDNSFIGAGAAGTKDIPDNSSAAGNPARFVCHTDAYIEKSSDHDVRRQYLAYAFLGKSVKKRRTGYKF